MLTSIEDYINKKYTTIIRSIYCQIIKLHIVLITVWRCSSDVMHFGTKEIQQIHFLDRHNVQLMMRGIY